jgi:hypothetical protein
METGSLLLLEALLPYAVDAIRRLECKVVVVGNEVIKYGI